MMDLLEATEDKIVRKVAGTDRTFKFLTAYDRAELLRADLKQRQEAFELRKEKRIKNLGLAGITGEAMYSELEAFDDQRPEHVAEQDWWNFVSDPLNDVTIYTISLRTEGDRAESIAKQAALSLTDKAKICGLEVVVKKADEANAPNPPQAPAQNATYWTPEQENSTGPKPTASSGTTTPP